MQIRTDPPVSLETLQTASAALSAAAKDPATARAASREACLERIADRRLAISAWRRSWAVVAFIGTLRPGAAGFIPGLAEFSALEGSEASVSARSSIDIGSLFLAAATCKLTIAGRLGRDFHRRLAEIRPALKDKFFTPDPE